MACRLGDEPLHVLSYLYVGGEPMAYRLGDRPLHVLSFLCMLWSCSTKTKVASACFILPLCVMELLRCKNKSCLCMFYLAFACLISPLHVQ